MLEHKDIVLLILASAIAFLVPALQSIQTKEYWWSVSYTCVAATLAVLAFIDKIVAWGVSITGPSASGVSPIHQPIARLTEFDSWTTLISVVLAASVQVYRRLARMQTKPGEFMDDALTVGTAAVLLGLCWGIIFRGGDIHVTSGPLVVVALANCFSQTIFYFVRSLRRRELPEA